MDPIVISFVVIATFCASSVLGLALAIAHAEDGYQDDSGFHPVDRSRVAVRSTIRATLSPFEDLPIRIDQH